VVVRYGLAGGVTQIVYISVLMGTLAVGWHYLAGIGVAQVCAISFAFPTYRERVFCSNGRVLPQLWKFLGVWWTGAAMSFVGVPLMVEGLGIRPLPAQLLVLVGVVAMSFLSHRGITFRAARDDGVSTVSRAPMALTQKVAPGVHAG
jgi:putative flippase GtrA